MDGNLAIAEQQQLSEKEMSELGDGVIWWTELQRLADDMDFPL